DSSVLVMGITFKENVSDIRNSKVADVVDELKALGTNVDVVDPYADAQEVIEEYGIDLIPQEKEQYDAVVLAVSHDEYAKLPLEYFESKLGSNGILFDVKGLLRRRKESFHYMSL
ncbi:MAG: UDP binding domain-containing protein, partial [Bacteroidales bacterium]|nr:UDP binding domain-containing protein [Bacteroidales bacterium]